MTYDLLFRVTWCCLLCVSVNGTALESDDRITERATKYAAGFVA